METKTNAEMRGLAREALRDNWGNAVVVTLIYLLIATVGGCIPVANIAVIIFIALPLAFGFYVLFLNFYRGDKDGLTEKLFEPFKGGNYFRALTVPLLVGLYTILWSLLLVIPGIVKDYSYAMAYFIAADNPAMTADQAIEESMRMMYGNKWRLFMLDLSFTGWLLLCIPTFGIGMLWLKPYQLTARVAFYEELKRPVVSNF